MNKLNDVAFLENFDKGSILNTIRNLPEQLISTWNNTLKLKLSKKYSNIVVCGMGGSALGARIIKSLMAVNLKIPLEIITDYKIPKYVNKDSLVLIFSYSGNTEESLSCLSQAEKNGAKPILFCASGQLKDLIENSNNQGVIFDTEFNPSNQPRMGLGYTISSILAILSKIKAINLGEEEFKQSVEKIKPIINKFDIFVENDAKKISKSLFGHSLILISGSNFVGNMHAFKNQINENSKNFAAYFDVPELNHHLLEGLSFPVTLKDNFLFLFIESDHYNEKIKKRIEITKEIVEKVGCKYLSYKLESSNPVEESLEFLVLSSFVSFYLAVLNNIDPSKIPWVDYFKKRLSN